jgi:hypothetical protein
VGEGRGPPAEGAERWVIPYARLDDEYNRKNTIFNCQFEIVPCSGEIKNILTRRFS